MGATTPIECWQFFLEAREVLGMPALQRIFGNVSTTSIFRWSRNPTCTADSQPGPLAHCAELLRMLVQQGRADLAEAGLRIVAEPCGARVSFAEVHAQADLPAPHSAAANLVEAVAELQRAARTGSDPKVVEALADVLLARATELTQSVRSAQAIATTGAPASGQRPRWSRGQVQQLAQTQPNVLSLIFRRRG